MEGARFLALLLYFEGRVEGRGAIAPLKHDALDYNKEDKLNHCKPLNTIALRHDFNVTQCLNQPTSLLFQVTVVTRL